MSLLGATSGPESGRVRAIMLIGGLAILGGLAFFLAWAWLVNDKPDAKDPFMLILGAMLAIVPAGLSFYFSGRQAENVAGTVAAASKPPPDVVSMSQLNSTLAPIRSALFDAQPAPAATATPQPQSPPPVAMRGPPGQRPPANPQHFGGGS